MTGLFKFGDLLVTVTFKCYQFCSVRDFTMSGPFQARGDLLLAAAKDKSPLSFSGSGLLCVSVLWGLTRYVLRPFF